MDYKKLILDTYEEQFDEEEQDKYDFIADVLDITTDDDEVQKILVDETLEVIEVILNKSNYEYIKNPENYIKYLRVVNSQFLGGKLEYGTSIRGAWFGFDKCGLSCFWKMEFTIESLSALLTALIAFWREH